MLRNLRLAHVKRTSIQLITECMELTLGVGHKNRYFLGLFGRTRKHLHYRMCKFLTWRHDQHVVHLSMKSLDIVISLYVELSLISTIKAHKVCGFQRHYYHGSRHFFSCRHNRGMFPSSAGKPREVAIVVVPSIASYWCASLVVYILHIYGYLKI